MVICKSYPWKSNQIVTKSLISFGCLANRMCVDAFPMPARSIKELNILLNLIWFDIIETNRMRNTYLEMISHRIWPSYLSVFFFACYPMIQLVKRGDNTNLSIKSCQNDKIQSDLDYWTHSVTAKTEIFAWFWTRVHCYLELRLSIRRQTHDFEAMSIRLLPRPKITDFFRSLTLLRPEEKSKHEKKEIWSFFLE